MGAAGMESSFYEESYSSTSFKGGSGYSAGGGVGFGDNLVQIKPQRVKMQLRMSEYYIQLVLVAIYFKF